MSGIEVVGESVNTGLGLGPGHDPVAGIPFPPIPVIWARSAGIRTGFLRDEFGKKPAYAGWGWGWTEITLS